MTIFVIVCQEDDYDYTAAELRGVYASRELAESHCHYQKVFYGPMKAPRSYHWERRWCCEIHTEEIHQDTLDGRRLLCLCKHDHSGLRVCWNNMCGCQNFTRAPINPTGEIVSQ